MQYLTLIPEIQREIEQNQLTLLYIKAPNCGVCTVIEKHAEQLIAQMPQIHGIKANIADTPELASHFHALTAPLIVLFYQGKEVERFARFVPYEQLKETLRGWAERAKSE